MMPIWAIVRRLIGSSSVRPHRMAGAPVGGQRAVPRLDMRFVLVAEVLEGRHHRRDRGIAEGAQRLAADVGGNAGQQIEIAHLSFTALDLPENLVEPVGALATGCALAARFVA